MSVPFNERSKPYRDAMMDVWRMCGTSGIGFTPLRASAIAAAAAHGINVTIAELPSWYTSLDVYGATLTPDTVNEAINRLMNAIEIIPNLKMWELPARWFTLDYGKIVLEAYLAANDGDWITVAEARQKLNMSYQAIASVLARGTIRTLPHPNPERNPKQVLLNREDVDREASKRSAPEE